jgi:hypothetical protein
MAVIKREEREKQETPRMTLVTLIQAAQGDIGNIERNPNHTIGNRERAERAQKWLTRAQKILRQMEDYDKWDTQPY